MLGAIPSSLLSALRDNRRNGVVVVDIPAGLPFVDAKGVFSQVEDRGQESRPANVALRVAAG